MSAYPEKGPFSSLPREKRSDLIAKIGGKIDPSSERSIASADAKSEAATARWRAKRSAAKERNRSAAKEREAKGPLEGGQTSAAVASRGEASRDSRTTRQSSPFPTPTDARTGTAGPFPTLTRRQIRERKQVLASLPSLAKPHVLLDTGGFDELQSPTQLRSLAAQMYRMQATLVRTARPLQTTFVGMGVEFEEKYLSDDAPHWEVKVTHEPVQAVVPQTENLVYLSPEATEPLLSLSLSDTYVIGGIVDTNSMKGLSHTRAEALGVRVRRLPLAECGMKVTNSLNVNHCYDVLSYVSLLQFGPSLDGVESTEVLEESAGMSEEEVATARWTRAFNAVLPPRLAVDPFKVSKQKRRGVGASKIWVTPVAWFAMAMLGARMVAVVAGSR
mmetsp:Transcript_13029/g.41110  ORF Transcript_13029/g.41110 Transcript_13029/m.41110 type:complete len:388 (-) Transcript_13029:28-1191(-)